jgi:branched-chain amino acid transport system substrate-binding protein
MPKAFISGGGGELEPDFINAVGNLADDNFTYLPFPPDILLSQKFAWAKPMAEEFKKDYNVEISGNSGEAYGIFWILLDAIQRAGSTDREKIREALAKTNITEESAKTNKMHLSFSPRTNGSPLSRWPELPCPHSDLSVPEQGYLDCLSSRYCGGWN